MTSAEGPAPRRSMTGRIVGAYAGMRRETRELLEQRPSEPVLLSFMAISGLALFTGGAAQLFLRARLGEKVAASKLQGELGGLFLASFVLLPLGVYLLSVIATPVLRALKGAGGFYETRLAIAWSAAVAFPLILSLSTVDMLVEHTAMSELAGFSIKIAPSAIWTYLLASAVAAAHEFRSARSVLGVTAAVVCGVVAVGLLARGVTIF